MDLSSDLGLYTLYDSFEKDFYEVVKVALFDKYRHEFDELEEIITYLSNNDIKDNDISIQITLRYFLQFASTLSEDKIIIIRNNKEEVTLLLVKFTLSILNKIKLYELDDIKNEAKEIEAIKAKVSITQEEFTKAYGYTKSHLDNLRANYKIDFLQEKKENGLPQTRTKVLYETKAILEYFDRIRHDSRLDLNK